MNKHRLLQYICSCSVGIFAFFVMAGPLQADAKEVVIKGESLEVAQKIAQERNENITHQFPPSIGIADISEETIAKLEKEGFTIESSIVSLESELFSASSPQEKIILKAWNEMRKPETVNAQSVDAQNIQPPDVVFNKEGRESGVAAEALAESATFGVSKYETSEFLYGSVLVNVILPESNGDIDISVFNWTEAQETKAIAEIQNGLNWWKGRAPNANLSFVYNIISGRTDERAQTKYEPLTRAGHTKGAGGEGLWIDEIMGNLGYTGNKDYIENARAFVVDEINKNNTNWGFTIFVPNNGNSENHFTDNTFAYAYYGGPFLVSIFNSKGYTSENLDMLIAHETAHIFYALDQYPSAQQDCFDTAGYLNVENHNSQYSKSGTPCSSNVPSIMRSNISAFTQEKVDEFALGQMGVRDEDGDGIYDPVDTKPRVTINSKTGSSQLQIMGTAIVQPRKNENQYTTTLHEKIPARDVTTNTITKVEYRINGGTWAGVGAADGAFNTGQEDFIITTPSLGPGNNTIDVRATNSVGNISEVTSFGTGVTGRLIVTGAGDGGGPHVRFFNPDGTLADSGFFAFPREWRTGVRVAAGDVDGDGIDEIVAAPGPGQKPLVRVFNSNGTLKREFLAYPEQFSGGVYVATGDVDNNGIKEIITGTGNGGGPQVRVFDMSGNVKFTPGFFAYGKTFRGGVFVGSGDFNGDGKEEILTGAGVGGGPQVMGYTRYGVRILNYFAYADNIRTGVQVSAGDVDGDGKVEIITGPGTGGGPHVRVFTGKGEPDLGGKGFFAYAKHVRSGAGVTTYDFNQNGAANIISSAGPGGGPQVRRFDGDGTVVQNGFFAYDEGFRGGVNVSAGNF